MKRTSQPPVEDKPTPKGRSWRTSKGIALGSLIVGLAGIWAYVSASDQLAFLPKDHVVSEVTQLEHIQVAAVKKPVSIDEISWLLRETRGPVSIGGSRASMGGQVAEPGSLHLDLRSFNRVLSLDVARRQISVQAGATWRDILDVIDPHNLSIRIMQTYSNFTVGGSLSVNAHGRYLAAGPIVQSVESLRLVMADGQILTASRTENPELFFGVIGGYGSLAVIAEVTLNLTDNSHVERLTETLVAEDYGDLFEKKLRHDSEVVFQNADLHPPDFTSARSVSWRKTNKPLTLMERLIPRGESYPISSRFINGTASFPLGFAFRRYVAEPFFYSKELVTTRNHEASYDIAELEPESREDTTFVLREYFVPTERYREFLPRMREIFRRHEVKVVNVSVRHATLDPGTILAWSRGETFAFVVYYEQGTDPGAVERVGEWSRTMVDAALEVGGSYYLPYQNHPTRAQFERAYPRAPELFALKRRVDPALRFQNSLWAHYGPSPRVDREVELERLDYGRTPEGRTLLTIPEWYLVWNPGDYAEHLEHGHPSDTFPYFESVREYWSLYKKVLRASEGVYSKDDEYLTTLRVIGLSTTVEYLAKGIYESTFGRLFRAIGDLSTSPEDLVISGAYRNYAEFVYDEPWYAFRFVPHVARLWRTPFWGSNFLRRTERKLFFTVEFATKAAYATALGLASGAAYGPASEQVSALIRLPEGVTLTLPKGVATKAVLASGEHWIQLKRWRAFSVQVPELARQGVEFVDIARNDDIAVSVVQEKARPTKTSRGRLLLYSKILSDASKERVVYWVSVPKLSAFLRDIAAQGGTLEHIYDY